jgi:hypothetical protein
MQPYYVKARDSEGKDVILKVYVTNGAVEPLYEVTEQEMRTEIKLSREASST